MGRYVLLATLLLAPLAGIAYQQTRSLPLIRKITGNQITVSRLDSEGQAAVKLRWRPVSGAHRYVVTTSPSADFADAKPLETRTTALTLKLAPNATHFWRVKAVHKNGQRLSEMSEKHFKLTIDYFP